MKIIDFKNKRMKFEKIYGKVRNHCHFTDEYRGGVFFYIYNLHLFKQKCYSHKVLVYLNVPEIPVKKPFQNRQIVEEQLDVSILLINKRIKTVNILT